jgi:phosphatidylglycerophosphate synthase
MIVGTGATVATGSSGWLVLPGALSFVALWRCRAPCRSLPLGGVGWADALTGARLVVLALTAASLPSAANWVLAAFTFNVAVDVLDGYVARKVGAATSFGAIIDRETDAFFVLVAYLHSHLAGALAPWLLFAGVLPYAYRLLASPASISVSASNKERLAAPLAGINFLLLLGAVGMPAHAAPLLGTSVLVVSVSFSFSFWSLYRHAYPLP